MKAESQRGRHTASRKRDGDRWAVRIDARQKLILSIVEDTRNLALEELKTQLVELRQASVLPRYGASSAAAASLEKSARAGEQNRPEVLKRRRAWFVGEIDLDPEKLVLIDQTRATANIARKRGRGPPVPWKATIFVAGLRPSGLIAPVIFVVPIDGVWFLACADQVAVETPVFEGPLSLSTIAGRSREQVWRLSSRLA